MTEQRSSHALENSLQTLPLGFFLRQCLGCGDLLAIKLMLLIYLFCRGLSQLNTRWQRDISPWIWGKAHSLVQAPLLHVALHVLFCSIRKGIFNWPLRGQVANNKEVQAPKSSALLWLLFLLEAEYLQCPIAQSRWEYGRALTGMDYFNPLSILFYSGWWWHFTPEAMLQRRGQPDLYQDEEGCLVSTVYLIWKVLPSSRLNLITTDLVNWCFAN